MQKKRRDASGSGGRWNRHAAVPDASPVDVCRGEIGPNPARLVSQDRVVAMVVAGCHMVLVYSW